VTKENKRSTWHQLGQEEEVEDEEIVELEEPAVDRVEADQGPML
jgi:hypothetical protein